LKIGKEKKKAVRVLEETEQPAKKLKTIVRVGYSLADKIILARINDIDSEDKKLYSCPRNKYNLIICLFFTLNLYYFIVEF
jgi:hypothetical protein